MIAGLTGDRTGAAGHRMVTTTTRTAQWPIIDIRTAPPQSIAACGGVHSQGPRGLSVDPPRLPSPALNATGALT
ncbi:MAG TPA: hypothetical protein VF592_00345 [Sphingomonas sp.]|jgi:hypothetical protein|uniref:hypothetical protein n=1 Tax=Sphingomonas sp. TaxID=28214 RepID=UPI002EDB8AC0